VIPRARAARISARCIIPNIYTPSGEKGGTLDSDGDGLPGPLLVAAAGPGGAVTRTASTVNFFTVILCSMALCAACGKPALLACSRCKIVHYCAPACLVRDWSSHKGACKPPPRAKEGLTTVASIYGLCAAECGKAAILRCSGCLGAFYCGQGCQKREWRKHKEQCGMAARVIATLGLRSIDDLDEKFSSIIKEAEAGNRVAQFNLGLSFEKGLGVAVNKAEAAKWYKRAAEAGVAEAQCQLGELYETGSGVAVDKVAAAKWYKRAAYAGIAHAQFRLGVCYHYGSGVAYDKAEAFKWHKRAASAGKASSQFFLGHCYNEGSGVAVDKAEAARWFKRAAEAGDAGARAMLAGTSDGGADPWWLMIVCRSFLVIVVTITLMHVAAKLDHFVL
jgi:hypothetical protein